MSHSEVETNLKDKVSRFSLEITYFIVSKWLSKMTHQNESYPYLINTWCHCCYNFGILGVCQTSSQSEKFHDEFFLSNFMVSDYFRFWSSMIRNHIYRARYHDHVIVTWRWRSWVAKTKNVWGMTYKRGWHPMRADKWRSYLDRIWFVTNPKWSPTEMITRWNIPTRIHLVQLWIIKYSKLEHYKGRICGKWT